MSAPQQAMNNAGILTMGFGKPQYIEMAKSLARSLMVHDPDVPRALVTDSTDPELRALFTDMIEYRPEYGSNVRQKMYLDCYSPFSRTLFIDSDCLALRPLTAMWTAFEKVPFGVCGVRRLTRGESDEFLDVDFILNRFGLECLPKFNGGIYYFDNSNESHALFTTARELLNDAKALNFSDFRSDGPADEALYSVAMAMHGLTVTDPGIHGMWTPINATGPITIDVPKGVCRFEKQSRLLTPDIVHFATITDSFTYLQECLKLECLTRNRPVSMTQLLRLRAEVAMMWLQRKASGLKRRMLVPAS